MFLFITISAVFYLSCENPENDPNRVKKFYDLKGFVEAQIVELDRDQPVVEKTMAIEGQNKQRRSNEINWKKELELFLQADINKPAYGQSYSLIRPDSLTYQYLLKDGEDLPVRRLIIKLNEPGGVPVRVNALMKSENRLYRSEKEIGLICEVKGKVSRIVSYNVTGFQKLAMVDKKPFLVKALIKY